MKLKIEQAEKELCRLQNYLPGETSYNNSISSLKIDKSIGEGIIKCTSLDEGIIAIELDITLNEDTYISVDDREKEIICFIYCMEGNCYHQFSNKRRIVHLNELQTGVAKSTQGIISKILLKKGAKVVLSLIKMDNSQYFKNLKKDESYDSDESLYHMLESLNLNDNFHLGSYNLRIAEHIKRLKNEVDTNDISYLLRFEGICHLILATHIDQFRKEKNNDSNPTSLTRKELKKIEELSDFIKNNFDLQHTIKNLCGRSGLSPAKLQEGFKFMHDRTVSDFIRNIRVERAEQLIKTTDLNISEIVYSIGFTSRSYFCKIFKNKYRCSPKRYKNNAVLTGPPV